MKKNTERYEKLVQGTDVDVRASGGIAVDKKHYQNMGMYLFGNKWNNQFVATDRRWVLYIYSPMLSESFKKAYDDTKDLMEMRRVTYWGLTQPIDDISKEYLDGFYKTHLNISNYTGGYGARLQQNREAGTNGVTVYYRPNAREFSYETIQFDVIPRRNNDDANFPVDIKLFVNNNAPSLGTIFYREHDFIGRIMEASAVFGQAALGRGFIYGHLKGFGYTEYTYRHVAGSVGWSLLSGSIGTMEGNYMGKGIASPNSFIGTGETNFVGAGPASVGNWRSEEVPPGLSLWEGKIANISISLGGTSVGRIRTYTEIQFPMLSSRTKNIFETNYDK